MQEIKNFPDSEMVSNLRSGKMMDDTIKTIYRDCFDSLSWYIMNNSGNRQDAEDIFQEAVVSFIDIVRKDKFRSESSVKTFLFSLNRHLWLNELKRRGRALAREEKYEGLRDQEQEDTSHQLIGKEASSQLMELVGRLGDTCKKILLLFYYENQSVREILDSLHYENEQVVRNKKYKCLKQLEQMMNENPAIRQTIQNLLHE
jgi:RNA polymerase sigma factor (sigma-70 family)